MPAQPPLKGSAAKDFSGGPNFRDAAPELAENECLDAWNMTFDERGEAASRKGFEKYNPSPFGSTLVSNKYWWQAGATLITQSGAKLYKGTSTSAVQTFSTSARCSFAEMAGKVIAIHPADGLYTSTDGTTWTAVADADKPQGTCLSVWQNKLWVAGNTTNPSRVFWSDAGDPTAWTATSFVDLRELNNERIVALHVGSGQDIQGRPGLLCFKQESTYRIHASDTGAYETIDATVGAASAISVIGVGAKVYTLSKHGVYMWQENQVGMLNMSDRFRPLWDPAQIALAQLDLFCAGRKGNRAVFSLCRFGSTANDLSLELHTDQGWIAPGSNAMSCYASSAGATEVTYGGSPTVVGQVYQLDSTGADDGVAISWRFQTRWFEPSAGFLASLWQVRLHGRGVGTMTLRTDYMSAAGSGYAFDFTTIDNKYDTGLTYDSGITYSIPVFQTSVPFYSLGTCRQFSLVFTGSSSTTANAPQVLGAGTQPTVGYFGLSGFEYLYTQLGLA